MKGVTTIPKGSTLPIDTVMEVVSIDDIVYSHSMEKYGYQGNGTYGASKDKHNPLFDPRQANRVCIYGQLLLLDLIEHLEPHCQIIQSNTDGVLVRLRDGSQKAFDAVDEVAYEWEQRTGLVLEFDEFSKVVQKDVNNYLIVTPDGKRKSKGAYVKKLGNLDYDLAIVNKAVTDCLLDGIPVEKTIRECDVLKDFQLVKKVGSKYKGIYHGEKFIKEKCVRCFASKYARDGGLQKLHKETGRFAKIEGTPERARLVNGEINGMNVPDWLDRDWYIEMAQKRVNDFIGKRQMKEYSQEYKIKYIADIHEEYPLLRKLSDKCDELSVECIKSIGHERGDTKNLIQKIANVEILIEQIKYLSELDAALIEEAKTSEINRQLRKMMRNPITLEFEATPSEEV